MSLTFTKKHLSRLAEVMDSDYDSLEEAAKAVLAEAAAIYEERACWAVVGHLRWDRWRYERGDVPRRGEDGAWIDESDWKDSRIVVGPFATERQAQEAREKLAISTATGEEFSTWVFPMWHDTPHAYFTARKGEKKRLESLEDDSARARHQRAVDRRSKWFETYGSDAELPHDIDDESNRCGRCGQTLPDDTQGGFLT